MVDIASQVHLWTGVVPVSNMDPFHLLMDPLDLPVNSHCYG